MIRLADRTKLRPPRQSLVACAASIICSHWQASETGLTMASIRFLLLVLSMAATIAVAGISLATNATAHDGASSSSSGSSGSGSSNSGRGGGDDHGGDDRSGHGGGEDDGGGDDGGGQQGDNWGRGGSDDSDYVRDAVKDGRILSLKSVLQKIEAKRYGKVIDVSVRRFFFRDVYQLKIRDGTGAIRTLRVDAKRGTLLGDN
ncbi:PepSY domain-containing protein [Rhizobium leguminosarum]|uniref:PepSY domain-containing protein n=1 Tax=Rhizobium leguminosarum bv. trifolii (strain WSM1325) TaxID=395491 RepID=C6B4M7_RHILS|nr:hypothetical protein [Rhizobium leguminosarum]ACS59035.1 hypothetical protein Rleg_4806 [Rhizobium leguminosarum bv. trifolii WSM1325]